MTGPIFVDTNLLVYSRDASERAKQPRAEAWRRALWQAQAGRLSAQVLAEYYVSVTRKLKPGMPRELARAEVRDLAQWKVVATSAQLIESAWDLEDQHQLSWWDALIVAGALGAGCSHLLSEDFQSGRNYGGVIVVNPFEVEPSALLEAE